MVNNLPAVQETWVQSLGREDTLEKGMAMHSSILSGEFHAQMSLAGYSPRGQKELDMTEQLTLSLSLPGGLQWTVIYARLLIQGPATACT